MLHIQDSDDDDLIDEAFGRIAFTTKVMLKDHFEVTQLHTSLLLVLLLVLWSAAYARFLIL